MSTRRHGARTGHRLKSIPAGQVRPNQIIEWLNKRCRVLAAFDPALVGRRGRSKEPAVLLRVVEMTPWGVRRDLFYYADEPVTVCGWSWGDPEMGGGWS